MHAANRWKSALWAPFVAACLAVALFFAVAPALAGDTADETAAATNGEKAGADAVVNPLAGVPAAIEAGKELYSTYGCYGCHGLDGAGHMGPSINDSEWRYGGSDADLFESISKGRPKGMPAWGDRFTEKQIWQVIAYVRSLYVGPDAGTK